MPTLVDQCFGMNLKIIRYLGYYPPQKNTFLYKLYSYAVYFFIVIPIPTLMITFLLTQEQLDLEMISNSAFPICELGSFIFRLPRFIIDCDQIHKSISLVELPVFLTFSKDQELIIKKCIFSYHRYIRVYLGFCILAWLCWAIVPFFAEKYILPVSIWVPVDISHGGLAYICFYVYLVIGKLFSLFVYTKYKQNKSINK